MSTKTIRNSFMLRVGSIAACAAALFLGCATKGDGDGSETHFLCSVDSDCNHLGTNYRCVETKCSPSAGGAAQSCPSALYQPDGDFGPSPSPPGWVDGGIFGCYPPRDPAPQGWMPTPAESACPGTSNVCTAYAPTDLPCGACGREGATCAMPVVAACDCGHGPFVDQYWDGWSCKCAGGRWDCRMTSPSGASCEACMNVCFRDPRGLPYSPGMVVTGPSGVTVTLSSTPAPPALGDNTWTFTVKDSGGALVAGATITVSQLMVDHNHGGAKAVTVTDLGGGQYRAEPVNFNMSGYWKTTLSVKKAPIDENIEIDFCIQ